MSMSEYSPQSSSSRDPIVRMSTSLDDRFCERVEREWTVATLLSYMRNADLSLQEKADTTLETASTYLAAALSNRGKPS